MLVLTRKVGEQIVVGDDICITIVAIRGDRVRVGITAPRETVVDRKEIHERRTAGDFKPAGNWPNNFPRRTERSCGEQKVLCNDEGVLAASAILISIVSLGAGRNS